MLNWEVNHTDDWLPGGIEQKLLIQFVPFGHCPLCIHPMIHFLEVHLLPGPQSLSIRHIFGRQIWFPHWSSFMQSRLSLQLWKHLPSLHLPSSPQSLSSSHDSPKFQTCLLVTVLNKICLFLLSSAKLRSKAHRWLPGGMEQ